MFGPSGSTPSGRTPKLGLHRILLYLAAARGLYRGRSAGIDLPTGVVVYILPTDAVAHYRFPSAAHSSSTAMIRPIRLEFRIRFGLRFS